MVTQNSWNSENPAQVAKGGTGLATLTTAYGVVCAGTTATAALQNAGAGTANQILVSGGAAALPAWTDIGAQVVSVATGVSLSSATPADITSISLTAGTWDISCIGYFVSSANTLNAALLGPSLTTATFEGTIGDQQFQMQTTGAIINFTASVPAFRVSPGSTTTYYLVGQMNFIGGTGSANGRISAVRIF